MMDFRFHNTKPKATLIKRFDGSAILLGPKGEKIEFDFETTLQQLQAKAEEFGWKIAVEHIHPSIFYYAQTMPRCDADSCESL